MAAGLAQQRASFVHVGGVARERNREKIDLQRSGGAQVLAILVGERARGQAPALAIDALVVAEFASDQHARHDPRTVDLLDLQADLAVVEQQHVADVHVGGELLVGDADRFLGTGVDRERGVEHEARAVGELRLAGGEAVDADLRALQIAQDADVAARLRGGLAHEIHATRMVGEQPVREIDPYDVDARAHHVGKNLGIIGGRT